MGLSSYPERLGRLFVVNVANGDAPHVRLAIRSVGLGKAMEAGRVLVLSGDRPKWAPQLLEVRAGTFFGFGVWVFGF